MNSSELIGVLQNGGVAVVRTDTLYGILARAEDEDAVQRVYALKDRDYDKPPIVLVADYDQLFDEPGADILATLKDVWPGAVSVIIPSTLAPDWITRGGSTVAYRMPNSEKLRELIRTTGPLIAPSANPQGKTPANNIVEAKQFFGDAVDWYEDDGEVVDASPSQLIRILQSGETERLR